MQRPTQTIPTSSASLPQRIRRRQRNSWVGGLSTPDHQRRRIRRGPFQIRRLEILPPLERKRVAVRVVRGPSVQLHRLVRLHGDFHRGQAAVLVDDGHGGVVCVFEAAVRGPLHAGREVGLVG